MHTLHTVNTFVLGRIPHGESNYTYRLFTREFGVLYAHAQAVRELRSRNRYALMTGRRSFVTLVRGREYWRITGAQESEACIPTPSACERKIAHLAGKLLAVEDHVPEIFDLLCAANEAFMVYGAKYAAEIEALTVLRLLDRLGYVEHPVSNQTLIAYLQNVDYGFNLFARAHNDQQLLITAVNCALREANH